MFNKRISITSLIMFFKQAFFLYCFDKIYELSRGLVSSEAHIAFLHGSSLIVWEMRHGLFIERSLQQLFLGSWLEHAANFVYAYCHFFATPAVLIWLYVAHRRDYFFVRNVVAFTTLLAFAVYIIYPLAPPRLFAEYGFVDTLARSSGVNFETESVKFFYNEFAAMPSLHFSWALIVGLSLACIARNWPWRLVGVAYPWVMGFTIVLSGNHFILDMVGALVVVAAGYGLALAFERYRAAFLTFLGRQWRAAIREEGTGVSVSELALEGTVGPNASYETT